METTYTPRFVDYFTAPSLTRKSATILIEDGVTVGAEAATIRKQLAKIARVPEHRIVVDTVVIGPRRTA